MKIVQHIIETNSKVYFVLKSLGYSENIIKKLRKQMGLIKLNNQPCTVREQTKAGDVLCLLFQDNPMPIVLAADIPLDIVFEDDDILLINKQHGLVVIPTASHFNNNLLSALKFRYGEDFPCHIVTRLDRDTSGLMLIAKNTLAHSILNQNIKERVTRKYLALVHGIINGSGEISLPIYTQESGMKRLVDERGQAALTLYKVISQHKNATLLEVELKTGRTHQIRVHFSHIGYPICGDKLYGVENDGYTRQTLHSCYISFLHPVTNKRLTFESFKAGYIDKLQ